MTFSLLKTKVISPQVPTGLVKRDTVSRLLDQCLMPGFRLALISAPAGFGKTTALVQWLSQLKPETRAAWFSLDDNDNQLGRFYMYLLEALRQAGAPIDAGMTEYLEISPDWEPQHLVELLVNQVLDSGIDLVLVMDDYHAITTPEIHQLLGLLIERLPLNMRLVVSGRVDPPIPLARLRARGQMVEIRTAELRFGNDDACNFLNRVSQGTLRAELAEKINLRAEGWAAGLQLTAIALRWEYRLDDGQPDAVENFLTELTGSHRYFLDYLLGEVLDYESTETREFLLKTSILYKFCASLCAAVLTGCSGTPGTIPSCQAMIEYLDHANLFVTPLDQTRTWYRYHHLFADVLHKQLVQNLPDITPELNRRAALWYEEQGMIDDALQHATQAKDYTLAVRIVENHALDAVFRGQLASALRWINRLPGEIVTSSPRLCLDRAWVLVFTSQAKRAKDYLEQAWMLVLQRYQAPGLESGQLDTYAQAIQSEALGLRGYHESLNGRIFESLDLLQEACRIAPVEPAYIRCSLHLFLAGAWLHAGDQEQAMQEYQAYQTYCLSLGPWGSLAYLQANFLTDLAFSLYSKGCTKQAMDLLQNEIDLSEAQSTRLPRSAVINLYVGLGKLLVYENRLSEAQTYLETALSMDPSIVSYVAFDCLSALWRIQYNRADLVTSRKLVERLKQLKPQFDETNYSFIETIEAMQDLVEGHTERLKGWANRNGFGGDPRAILARYSDGEMVSDSFLHLFFYAQYLALQGNYSDSIFVLGRLEQAAETVGNPWLQLRVRVRMAVVFYQAGKDDQALDILENCLSPTSRWGGSPERLFLENGEPARLLLETAAQRRVYPETVSGLLSAFPPPEEAVIEVFKQAHPASKCVQPLLEHLTERELEVLNWMALGLKSQEIADRLYVSLNTIRYHSRNIFSKLEVSTRTAAVARARELGILAA